MKSCLLIAVITATAYPILVQQQPILFLFAKHQTACAHIFDRMGNFLITFDLINSFFWQNNTRNFFVTIPCTYLCIWQIAGLGLFFQYNFFLWPYTAVPGFEPMSTKLHQTGTFEGCSTDWATAPRQCFKLCLDFDSKCWALNNSLANFSS